MCLRRHSLLLLLLLLPVLFIVLYLAGVEVSRRWLSTTAFLRPGKKKSGPLVRFSPLFLGVFSGFGAMMWLAFDQDKTNYPKRTGILLLFGLLQVPSPVYDTCTQQRRGYELYT